MSAAAHHMMLPEQWTGTAEGRQGLQLGCLWLLLRLKRSRQHLCRMRRACNHCRAIKMQAV